MAYGAAIWRTSVLAIAFLPRVGEVQQDLFGCSWRPSKIVICVILFKYGQRTQKHVSKNSPLSASRPRCNCVIRCWMQRRGMALLARWVTGARCDRVKWYGTAFFLALSFCDDSRKGMDQIRVQQRKHYAARCPKSGGLLSCQELLESEAFCASYMMLCGNRFQDICTSRSF